MIGVGLSLIILIFRTSRPYVAELGKVPDSDFYRNRERFTEVIVDNEVLVFRFDAQLFYANSSYFIETLELMRAKAHIDRSCISFYANLSPCYP